MLLVAMNHVARRQAFLAETEQTPDAETLAESVQPLSTPEAAIREAVVEPAPNAAAIAAAKQRREQFEAIKQQQAALENQRLEADEALRDEQLKLSQVERHMSSLTDRLRSLRAAYREMQDKEAEHYDDRAQAERNLAQMQDLIAEQKQEIEDVKAELAGKSQSFAIVPYEGANGSRRRPIYIECRNEEVLLQPEGLTLTADDFQRPLGVGNPLAAALRATREYYARDDPNAGIDPDAEPYPLILVRPDGIEEYYSVREAIRSWDSDFGYEMIDQDMELSFSSPDPALFALQTEAVRQTRIRRAMLARAAPSKFGGYASASGIARPSGPGGGQPYDGRTLGQPGAGQSASGGRGQGGMPGLDGREAQFDSLARTTSGGPGQAARAGQVSPEDGSEQGGNQFDSQANAGGGQAAGANGGNQSRQASAGGSAGSQSESSESMSGQPQASFAYEPNQKRKADWAVKKSSPTDIAISRPVPVVVRRDQIEVAGGTIPIDGPTHAVLDQLVARVQEQVRTWGIAGQGLYWKPVLQMNVAPDGAFRAQDLAVLLQRSGIEMAYPKTASGGNDATR